MNVIGIRFKETGKIYNFEPDDDIYQINDLVIVDTSQGQEIGKVAHEVREANKGEISQPLKKVIRKATEEDRQKLSENQEKEKEAFQTCLNKINRRGLNMKLIKVKYSFDRSKIIFYFSANGRVDFRELVKELASIFHTRIELRQIGVRDEAKLIGGIGSCGRSFCCVSFMEEFASVSIKMAKCQNLSLNPAKISGVCGRLMCCLRFEAETYEEVKDDYPEVNSTVATSDGEGRVVALNMIKKIVHVELKEGRVHREYPVEEVEVILPQ